MPLTEYQLSKIISDMAAMPDMEWREFNSYSEKYKHKYSFEECQFIFTIISQQRGYRWETNGTAADPKTITKFRKLPVCEGLEGITIPKCFENYDPRKENRSRVESPLRSTSKGKGQTKALQKNSRNN